MKKPSIVLALLAVLTWPTLALAQNQAQTPAAPEITALYACESVADTAAQLACYRQATQGIRGALEDGRLVAVNRAQVETIQRQSFGFSLPSLTNLLGSSESAGPEEIEATIQSVIERNSGRVVFVFEDGQRWEQAEDGRTRNVRPGDRVTVRRAALGSFMLYGSRGGRAHRVRRQE